MQLSHLNIANLSIDHFKNFFKEKKLVYNSSKTYSTNDSCVQCLLGISWVTGIPGF